MMRFLLEQALFLNLQALLLLPVLSFVASQNPPIAKLGCLDKCGNVSIPFPFGTTPGCFLSPDFLVTCNHTFKPPKLFFETTLEIKAISLGGQISLNKLILQICDDGQKDLTTNRTIRLSEFFTFNQSTKFTVVGCDSFGSGYFGLVYPGETSMVSVSGCSASCESGSDLKEGSCMGLGCCQNSVPPNAREVNITVQHGTPYCNSRTYGSCLRKGKNEVRHFTRNSSDVRGNTNCTYAFLVEDTAFNFSSKYLNNLKDVQDLPVVVDWAFGQWTTCEKEARNYSSDYACRSPNSSCYNPENGYGYRCRCNDGYHGNPYLSNGCQDIDECSLRRHDCLHECVNTPGGFNCTCLKGSRGDGKRGGIGCSGGESSHAVWLVAGIATGIILLLLLACLAYVGHNRRKSKRVQRKWFIQNGGDILLEKLPNRGGSQDIFKIFTSSELKKATNDFHKCHIVGHGGFGTVYRGVLLDKRIVAIKKSKIADPDQIEQFINEVIVISQTNHRNIVKLLGCCLETEVPLLVYEFINNGTLFSHLHDPKKACLLNWEIRLRIATETAGVLWYLHSLASNPIIHRDVKSDNILLDDTYTAKVSDFGASKLIALDQTQISTVVQGTTGYLDPEYLQTHQLTAKSDVYSFGVVLLELLTGRKATNYAVPEKERSLVMFSLSMLEQEDDFFAIIDGNIATKENKEQLMEVARLAKWCLKMSGKERPTMNIVAMELERLRVGRKQLPDQIKQDATEMQPSTQDAKEMQSSVVEGFAGTMTDSGCGSSISTGFDSYGDKVVPPFSGGR